MFCKKGERVKFDDTMQQYPIRLESIISMKKECGTSKKEDITTAFIHKLTQLENVLSLYPP